MIGCLVVFYLKTEMRKFEAMKINKPRVYIFNVFKHKENSGTLQMIVVLKLFAKK